MSEINSLQEIEEYTSQEIRFTDDIKKLARNLKLNQDGKVLIAKWMTCVCREDVGQPKTSQYARSDSSRASARIPRCQSQDIDPLGIEREVNTKSAF